MAEQPIAVVTGGDGFIGSAVVSALEKSGHQVLVIDRSGRYAADLQHEAEVRRVAAQILAGHGRCDVLVHAAAAFVRADLAALDAATLREAMSVNIEAPLWLCQEFAPGMAARQFGRIVFITSDTVWDPPVPGLLPYIITKMGLIGAARSLARALGPQGITVNCVAPGLTPPPWPTSNDLPADWDADVVSRQAVQRTLVPEDVAAVVAFLASEAAAAMSGQTLCPDGGLILR